MSALTLPPRAATLTGRFLRLEPLSIVALRELAPKLRVPAVFAGGHAGGAAALPDSDEDYVAFFADYAPWGRGGRSFVVRLADGRAVGTTSLYDLDPVRESVAIGYTAYAPEVWGSSVNPDAKRTLLAEVFARGAGRTLFHVDAANERSRAAVVRLGARLDGVLRRDARRADGSWRDTAVYSILAEEWPRVRERLDARLDAAAGRGG